MKVVVVGAGIIGHAIAYELAARGAQVEILDPRGPGQGATRASAGILAPYIEGHSTALLELGLRSLNQYDAFISRVAADAGKRIEYRRLGTLQVALNDGEASRLEEQSRALADADVEHSLLTREDTLRLEPALTTSVRAGLRIPRHGYVGARSLMSALVAASAAQGTIATTARVAAVEDSGATVRVVTSAAHVVADAAVIAAGSWSGEIPLGKARSPVRPVRGQLLELALPQPLLQHVVWGSGCYIVPWQSGGVLVGATVEEVGFDENVTDAGVRQLTSNGETLVPRLAGAALVEARAGLRPATADDLPIIGPSSTMRGVYLATGHYRNGVLLAPLTAALIADLVVDGRSRPELELVRPDRFGL